MVLPIIKNYTVRELLREMETFERMLIQERTRAGLTAAMPRGRMSLGQIFFS
jgi:DNA invertase Pin-like site-specific DNA recombinase